jgi:hypothetical protein
MFIVIISQTEIPQLNSWDHWRNKPPESIDGKNDNLLYIQNSAYAKMGVS